LTRHYEHIPDRHFDLELTQHQVDIAFGNHGKGKV
jgi:hypothetical protein